MTDLGQFLSSLHLLSFCDLNPNHDEMRSLKSHSFRRFELNKYQKQCLLNNDDSHKWELGIHGILTVNNFVTHSWLWQTSSWNLSAYSHPWDVSGFVRLFYILSKNKIFRIFGRHILDFWPIISRFPWIYHTFPLKIYFSSKSRISAQNRIRPCQIAKKIKEGQMIISIVWKARTKATCCRFPSLLLRSICNERFFWFWILCRIDKIRTVVFEVLVCVLG